MGAVQEIFKQAVIPPHLLSQVLSLGEPTAIEILLKSMSADPEAVTEESIRTAHGLLVAHLKNVDTAAKLSYLFQKRPYFGFKILLEQLRMQPQDLQKCAEDFDANPTQSRDKILPQQFDISRTNSVADDLFDIKTKKPISKPHAETLKQAFYYVNEIGYRIKPLSGFAAKPISQLTREALLEYFNRLRHALSGHIEPKDRTLYQLELLAIMREVMFRTTGVIFPYSTQIISVINDTIYHQGNVSSQVKTGEGKTIITCLKAMMLWVNPGHTVDVCTSNLELAAQALREFQTFYEYLEVPVTLVEKDSPDRTFKFNGINFSCTNLALNSPKTVNGLR
jgi:hypothetical protein